ncbi:AAA family ATPase [Luedemannella flava]
MDYEFRFKLQDCMLVHGEHLRAGASVVVEFGSWSRAERESIRQVAVREGATTELHFLDAPLDELVRRVRARGGPDAEALATDVLLGSADQFERPSPDEIALFDRYVAPDDPWHPAIDLLRDRRGATGTPDVRSTGRAPGGPSRQG